VTAVSGLHDSAGNDLW